MSMLLFRPARATQLRFPTRRSLGGGSFISGLRQPCGSYLVRVVRCVAACNSRRCPSYLRPSSVVRSFLKSFRSRQPAPAASFRGGLCPRARHVQGRSLPCPFGACAAARRSAVPAAACERAAHARGPRSPTKPRKVHGFFSDERTSHEQVTQPPEPPRLRRDPRRQEELLERDRG